MRLAIVSDIHGNLPALLAVVEDFRADGVDSVINLGDNLSGPLCPQETARYLMQQDWTHLAGNHDRYLLTRKPEAMAASDRFAHDALGARELDWLKTLKSCQRFDDSILLCHGTPRDDEEYLMETVEPDCFRLATRAEISERLESHRAELLLCGHTHIARSVRAASGTLIVNPGSVGQPGYYDDVPFRHFVETGSAAARYAMVERRAGTWRVQLRSVDYEHGPMVELARQRKRDAWAQALASGYVRA